MDFVSISREPNRSTRIARLQEVLLGSDRTGGLPLARYSADVLTDWLKRLSTNRAWTDVAMRMQRGDQNVSLPDVPLLRELVLSDELSSLFLQFLLDMCSHSWQHAYFAYKNGSTDSIVGYPSHVSYEEDTTGRIDCFEKSDGASQPTQSLAYPIHAFDLLEKLVMNSSKVEMKRIVDELFVEREYNGIRINRGLRVVTKAIWYGSVMIKMNAIHVINILTSRTPSLLYSRALIPIEPSTAPASARTLDAIAHVAELPFDYVARELDTPYGKQQHELIVPGDSIEASKKYSARYMTLMHESCSRVLAQLVAGAMICPDHPLRPAIDIPDFVRFLTRVFARPLHETNPMSDEQQSLAYTLARMCVLPSVRDEQGEWKHHALALASISGIKDKDSPDTFIDMLVSTLEDLRQPDDVSRYITDRLTRARDVNPNFVQISYFDVSSMGSTIMRTEHALLCCFFDLCEVPDIAKLIAQSRNGAFIKILRDIVSKQSPHDAFRLIVEAQMPVMIMEIDVSPIEPIEPVFEELDEQTQYYRMPFRALCTALFADLQQKGLVPADQAMPVANLDATLLAEAKRLNDEARQTLQARQQISDSISYCRKIYTLALRVLDFIAEQNCDELRVTLLSNRSEMQLQLGDPAAAIADAELALAFNPDHAKSQSRLRRAQKKLEEQ